MTIGDDTVERVRAEFPQLETRQVRRVAQILIKEVGANVAACKKKRPFSTAADANDWGKNYGQYPYRCAVCDMWHLTRKKTWRPIESAPQDGTPVRLRATFKQNPLGYVECVGSFKVHAEGAPPEWRMHSKDIGWCRANPPTSWRPL